MQNLITLYYTKKNLQKENIQAITVYKKFIEQRVIKLKK